MKKLTFLLLFCLLANLIFAQKSAIITEKLQLLGRYQAGKIELRWYPASAVQWRTANANGYTLERMDIANEQANTYQRLSKQAIEPYTPEAWRSLLKTGDKYAEAVSKVLAQPVSVLPSNATFAQITAKENAQTAQFTYFLLATDFSADASLGAGLRFVDETALPNKTYMYRLSVNNLRKPTAADTVVWLVNTSQETPKTRIESCYLLPKEKAVVIHWENQNDDLFNAYHIERSADNGKTFQRLTKQPFAMMVKDKPDNFYTDSVKNYVPYQYRIVGLTPFGDVSEPSVSMKGIGLDLTPPNPVQITKAEGDNKQIRISWRALGTMNPDLKGYYIGRSHDVAGPFKYLNDQPITSLSTSFVDKQPIRKEPYYVVVAVDTAQNTSPSIVALAEVDDNLPPAKPKGIRGLIDSTGAVSIVWEANTEEDFKGYQVFVADRKDDEFFSKGGVPFEQTTYKDTVNLKTLKEKIYYKINAVDFNNNTSPFSDIVAITLPDRVPPAEPLLTNYSVSENGEVKLNWELSSSQDVVSYQLWRQVAGAKAMILQRFGKEIPTNFTDKTAIANQTYTYTLEASDDVGLTSKSNAFKIKVLNTAKRPAVEKLTSRYNTEKKEMELSWTYPKPTEGTYKFMVYRSAGTQEMSPYKSLTANNLTFKEESDVSYKYAVKVIYKDGGESELVKGI